jgi:hypothetical protein
MRHYHGLQELAAYAVFYMKMETKMNQAKEFQQSYKQQPAPPQPVLSKRKPRLFLVLIPASLWLLHYVLKNSDCVISWNSIMSALDLRDKEMFTQLFVLMTVATVVIIISKTIKKN